MSGEVDSDLRRAEALIDVNRHRDALPILTSVIAAHPQNARAYCLFARCQSLNGNHGAMLTAASKAIAYAPELEWGYRLQSMALRSLGRLDEAEAAAMTSVRLAPHLWQPYVNLVEALLKSPDRDKRRRAYEAAKTAVGLAPNHASTHVTLGRVYLSIGELGTARRCFEHALGLNPDDVTAHTNLAILDLSRGRVTAAGQGFGSVVATNPDNQVYLKNVTVAAGHWYARALDIGTLVCLVQIALSVCLPAPLSGYLALGLLAAYVLTTAAMFARLPRALRTLVARHVRTRDGRATLLFLLFAALIGWSSVADALDDSSVRQGTSGDLLVLALLGFIRFRVRIRRRMEPFLLRCRYRRHVLGRSGRRPSPAQP